MKHQIPPKKCLTIDKRDVNNLGPSKFRTGAENGHQQICYFNRNKKDEIFNRFVAVRKETSVNEIIFSIVNLIDKSNNLGNVYYKIDNELKEFNNDRLQFKRIIRRSSPEDIAGTGEQQQQQQPVNETKQEQRQQHVSKKPRFLSR